MPFGLGNVWPMPRLPAAGLALISFGGLWLCLWRQPWRRWGIAAIAAGLVGMALTRPPDIVLADLGRFLAVRSPDGAYWSAADHGEQIQASFLRAETGLDVLPWPPADESRALGCANALCRYSARGRSVAIVTGTAALPLDCGGFDAIVSQVPAGFRCRSIIPVIDRIDAWRLGSVALWFGKRDITIDSTNGSRGDRPWVPHPRPRRRAPTLTTSGGS